MKTYDSNRRDLLRLSSMGLAASAFTALPALAKKPAAPALSPMLFDVRTFGATGDGKTADSPAINKAIEAAAAAGGGTVFFPGGNYICFSIRLKSHVDLYLSQGCTIIAADSPKPGETTGYMGGTYDAAEPKNPWDAYQDYGHNHWHNSLFWGDGISDFSITGPGLIWGKGLSYGLGPGRPPAGSGASGPGFGPGRPDAPAAPGAPGGAGAAGVYGGARAAGGAGAGAAAAQAGSSAPGAAPGAGAAAGAARPGGAGAGGAGRNARGSYTVFQAEQPGVANKAIGLKNCHNVVLRDFSILKGGHFAILVTGVDNLTIDNLRIDTDRDGMDIDCCKNVRVSNCTVNSPWDDAIVPKSSFALGYNRPCENMNITNCYVSGCWELGSVIDGTWKRRAGAGGTGRIKCGTESNGGFINIAISNCVFEGCQGYALESVDGALLEDIAITNTTMRDLVSGPLFMRLGARLRGPKETTKVGTLRRIMVSNLACYAAPQRISSILSGIPDNYIEDVKLSNIYIETVGGATADAAQIQPPELESKYPEPSMFGPMPASGFFLRHVRNVEMSHVEIANATPDARPAFYLTDVTRADFFAVTAPRNADGAFALHDVKDLRIGWSRAAADTTLAAIDNKML